jgi:hypothetical protein
MKNLFLSLGLSLAAHALLPYQSMAQTNLIANGDFETQYATVRPSQELNIKGNRASNVDELPSWLVPSAGSGPSTVTSNATFLATNASNPDINPTTTGFTFIGPFAPHNNSVGCVGLKRSLFYPAYDGLITQQVALTPGHTYQFSYYIMKRPGAGYASKFAFNVINSSSTPALSANNATSSFQPVPAIIITTDFLTSTNWTYVTGSFTAQTPPANTKSWIVVGYDRSAEQVDPNAGGATSGNEIYIIDDVSLVDMGCIAPTLTNGLDLNTDKTCGDKTVRFTVSAQDRANNPGATFELTATGSNYVLTYGSADHSSCNIRIRNQSSFNVLATATNLCGTGPVFDTGTFTGSSFLDGCFTNATQSPTAATAYPNPATESLTISQSAEQAVLLNSQGQAVQKPDASGKLRVQDLPAGLYNLQMQQDGKLINQRIQVKH